MYDTAIIGAGPAGVSAALNLKLALQKLRQSQPLPLQMQLLMQFESVFVFAH